jgi:hypothetical protein
VAATTRREGEMRVKEKKMLEKWLKRESKKNENEGVGAI